MWQKHWPIFNNKFFYLIIIFCIILRKINTDNDENKDIVKNIIKKASDLLDDSDSENDDEDFEKIFVNDISELKNLLGNIFI